jgi:short-subunit dehydrogenase
MVVITGITKGIGRAIAELFASRGYHLLGCARNLVDLQNFKQEIEQKYNISCLFFCADLSQPQDLDNFVAFLQQQNQPLNCLVNNAAWFQFGQLSSEDESVLLTMLHTNLFAPFRLIQAVLPAMVIQKKGHIFNICSTVVHRPRANMGSYGVSKFALYGMTKLLREELKPQGIKVTAVLPSATLTASWEGVEIDPNRLIDAADIAKAVVAAFEQSDRSVTEEICISPQMGDVE